MVGWWRHLSQEFFMGDVSANSSTYTRRFPATLVGRKMAADC
jgi:hypothetical protein